MLCGETDTLHTKRRDWQEGAGDAAMEELEASKYKASRSEEERGGGGMS